MLTSVGALHRLVHDIGSDEHIFQVNSERVAQARHPDGCTIWISVILVSDNDHFVVRFPFAEKNVSGIEKRT
jgi:hypothetical protein